MSIFSFYPIDLTLPEYILFLTQYSGLTDKRRDKSSENELDKLFLFDC